VRYLETKQQSAEILRLTLPLMARQEAAYHPLSYALWYEHVAGINGPLTRLLSQRLSQNKALTESEVRRLYSRHISGRDSEAAERAQGELRAVLTEAASSTASAGAQVGAFEETVEEQLRRLGSSIDEAVLRTVATDLLAGTQRVRAVTVQLSETLAGCVREMSALSERLDQAHSEALLDPLTGLNNRRGFERAVELLEDGGTGLAGAALLVVDIDHFKAVNDTHGHLLGDKVIRAVAHVLRSNIKGRDIAVRLGGDEFAVLLPDTSSSGATALAEQIRVLVTQVRIRLANGQEHIGHVTVSLGVTAADIADTLESLIERADGALYAAKRAGRNQVSLAQGPRATD
jgi:diguanylate cyclase